MSSIPLPERGQGFSPNPNETVPPLTARDAFEDSFRYLATKTSRESVRKLAEDIDPAEIVRAVQGRMAGRPLSGFEATVGNTVAYCVRERLLQTPIEAIGILESVRQEILQGGVFIGQERVKS